MAVTLRFLFHLLPLVPAWYGRPYGVIAAVLFVALPYIKVFKLRADREFYEGKRTGQDDVRLEKEIMGLTTAIRRWQALTFLSWWESRRRGDGGSLPPPANTP